MSDPTQQNGHPPANIKAMSQALTARDCNANTPLDTWLVFGDWTTNPSITPTNHSIYVSAMNGSNRIMMPPLSAVMTLSSQMVPTNQSSQAVPVVSALSLHQSAIPDIGSLTRHSLQTLTGTSHTIFSHTSLVSPPHPQTLYSFHTPCNPLSLKCVSHIKVPCFTSCCSGPTGCPCRHQHWPHTP